MAYDDYLAERIRHYFTEKHLNYFEKKVMMGLVFMLNDKMCCGIHYDKKEKLRFTHGEWGQPLQKK